MSCARPSFRALSLDKASRREASSALSLVMESSSATRPASACRVGTSSQSGREGGRDSRDMEMRKDEEKGREMGGGVEGGDKAFRQGGDLRRETQHELERIPADSLLPVQSCARANKSWLLPQGTARGQRVPEWRRGWACSGPRPQGAGHAPTKNCAPSPHRPQDLCPEMGRDDPSHRPCPRSIRKSRGMTRPAGQLTYGRDQRPIYGPGQRSA